MILGDAWMYTDGRSHSDG